MVIFSSYVSHYQRVIRMALGSVDSLPNLATPQVNVEVHHDHVAEKQICSWATNRRRCNQRRKTEYHSSDSYPTKHIKMSFAGVCIWVPIKHTLSHQKNIFRKDQKMINRKLIQWLPFLELIQQSKNIPWSKSMKLLENHKNPWILHPQNNLQNPTNPWNKSTRNKPIKKTKQSEQSQK